MTAPQTPPPADPPTSANRAMLLRSASLAWTASTALLAVGLLLTAAWIWHMVRGQQQASEYSGGFDGESVSLTDRVDILLGFGLQYLPYAALVIAASLGLRLLADVAAVRAGGFSSRQAIGGEQPTEITLDRDDD